MARPDIVIGLGGTGQWVLTYLKRDLETACGRMPDNVRLLPFDIDIQNDAVPTEARPGTVSDNDRVLAERLAVTGNEKAMPVFTHPTKLCAHCDHVMTADARFCPYCGMPIAVDRYTNIVKLGEGSSGACYRAFDIHSKHDVVIKVPHGELVERNRTFVEQLQGEAQMAAQLDHPNIVRSYSVGEFEGTPSIEMEYVDGRALADLIKAKGSLTSKEALTIFESICAALGEAHAKDIVHRDIKPSNIVFQKSNGDVRVTDFGLAKNLESNCQTSRSSSSAVVGHVRSIPSVRVNPGNEDVNWLPRELLVTETDQSSQKLPITMEQTNIEHRQVAAKPGRKIVTHLYAVVSDIHANYEAPYALEREARQKKAEDPRFDDLRFICLGDTVDYGSQTNEYMAWLAAVQPMGVLRGNHDHEVLQDLRAHSNRVDRSLWPMTLWTPALADPVFDKLPKSAYYGLNGDGSGRGSWKSATPFFEGYRPQFYTGTMDVTGESSLPAGVEMVMPGDNVNLTVELIVPVALEIGSRFAIREGGRTVGAGVITKILEVTKPAVFTCRIGGNTACAFEDVGCRTGYQQYQIDAADAISNRFRAGHDDWCIVTTVPTLRLRTSHPVIPGAETLSMRTASDQMTKDADNRKSAPEPAATGNVVRKEAVTIKTSCARHDCVETRQQIVDEWETALVQLQASTDHTEPTRRASLRRRHSTHYGGTQQRRLINRNSGFVMSTEDFSLVRHCSPVARTSSRTSLQQPQSMRS